MRRLNRSLVGLAVWTGLLLSASLSFAETERLACTFHWENDAGAIGSGSDRDYTQGMRISCATAQAIDPMERLLDSWQRRFDGWNHDKALSSRLRGGFSIAQTIYTPQEIGDAEPNLLDRPFGAFLHYAIIGRIYEKLPHDQVHDRVIELQIGVVGPAAGGEFAQKEFHKMLRDEIPTGWRNQLPNEPAINLLFQSRRRIPFFWGKQDRPIVDGTPHYGFSLGNVFTQAAVGGTLRAGWNMPELPAAAINPKGVLDRLGSDDPTCGFAVVIHGEARYLAHNIFLDGNLFRDAPQVDRIDKKDVVYDYGWGASFQYRSWVFDYLFVHRTPEFETDLGEARSQDYGVFLVTYRLPR